MNSILKSIFLSLLIISCNQRSQKDKSLNIHGFERISKKGSYGFVNSSGDTIISLGKYKFLNPIDEEGMILANLNDKHGYIDINENIIIPFKYDDLSVFNYGLAPAKMNGKYGYINREGQVIIDFQYDNESHFNKCGLARAKKNNKFGFIDTFGNKILPIKFEKVRGNRVDSVICAMDNDKWAFFSCDGEQLTDFEFELITESYYDERNHTFFKSGPCRVVTSGKPYYINSKFQKVIKPGTYEVAQPFRNDFAIVSSNEKYGIINTKGEVVIPLDFENISHPSRWSNKMDLFILEKENKLQVLDRKTTPITNFDIVDYLWDTFDNGEEFQTILIIQNSAGKAGIVTEDGKLTSKFIYDRIYPFDGKSVAPATVEGKFGLINLNGKKIIESEYNKLESIRSTNLFYAENTNKSGIIDSTGRTIIPFEYSSIDPVYYDYKNKFIVEKNGLFGIVNLSNEIIIPIEYDEISNWVEYGPDEHFITKGAKKGLISKEGIIVIPPIYDEILVDNSELIKVKLNDKYGTVDFNHSTVHQIKYENIIWEWTFINPNGLDSIFVKEDGKYFITNSKGRILASDVSDELVKQKFDYIINDE